MFDEQIISKLHGLSGSFPWADGAIILTQYLGAQYSFRSGIADGVVSQIANPNLQLFRSCLGDESLQP
jgi:hypothetical protein